MDVSASKLDAHPLSFFFSFHTLIVGERSNFKKIPTHTQDHGDA